MDFIYLLDGMTDPAVIHEKVKVFEDFIENKLKVQLQSVLEDRDQIYTKISD